MGEVLVQYLKWHYSRGVVELLNTVRNFLVFLLHFFSIKLLLKTLFHPWRRMKENYSKGLDLGAIASSLLVNVIMRVVGAVSRLIIILLGIFILMLAVVLGILFLITWILAPFITLGLMIAGVTLIIKSI